MNPSKEAIKKARMAAGITQKQAAELIYFSLRTWQEWEGGFRDMHESAWELFCIKLERLAKENGSFYDDKAREDKREKEKKVEDFCKIIVDSDLDFIQFSRYADGQISEAGESVAKIFENHKGRFDCEWFNKNRVEIASELIKMAGEN